MNTDGRKRDGDTSLPPDGVNIRSPMPVERDERTEAVIGAAYDEYLCSSVVKYSY